MLELGALKMSVVADTKEATSNLSSFKDSAGKVASGIAKGFTVGLGTAVAGVSVLTKAAIDNYAEYEQLIGGVDTLFKNSSNKVQEYASNAYKTAGMSTNEYMETVTSFSASLLQSLEGDTDKAAEAANTAITDMSDNANKMGSDISSIQNAYQGFAKQNYTMLDNLKLGYGGTKEEMQRLLDDATKLSGVNYDINSLNDVYSAIHVVQTEMGITGTTSEEASTTISGSMASMKASYSNLVTGIADDNADFDKLIEDFVDSVSTVGDNIIPRVETTINGIAELIDRILPVIIDKVPSLIETVLPKLTETATKLITSLTQGIITALPMLLQSAMEIINTLVTDLLSMLPQLVETALQMIITIANGLIDGLPEMIPAITDIILQIVQTLVDNIPKLIDTAIQLILGFVDGIIKALPKIIEATPKIITSLINSLLEAIPQIIEAGITLFTSLITNLPKIIEELVNAIPEIITGIVDAFSNPETQQAMMNAGKALLESLWEGIKSLGSWLADGVTGLVNSIFGNDVVTPEVNANYTVVQKHADGGIMLEPTLFGMSGNTAHIGGEAGAEGIIPLSKLPEIMQQLGLTGTGNIVVNNYSPNALDEAESARQFKKTQRQLALGF